MGNGEFWRTKTLEMLDTEEWESLCDGCGKCCLIKLEDPDSGSIALTGVACRLLDLETGRCTDYAHRLVRVPGCLALTPQRVRRLPWLPETCAYRLVANGEDLPDWHPLKSGRRESVAEAGHTVARFAVSEADVAEEDQALHVIAEIEMPRRRSRTRRRR